MNEPGRVPLTDADRAQLEEMAYRIRRLAIEIVTFGQWGHIAGSVSMAEILSVLFFRSARLDPAEPHWAERDRIILSKAHTSPGLYAAMALRGYFGVDDLYGYGDIDGILEGHSDMLRTAGLESSGGLLGMGLSVAQGHALALRIRGQSGPRVFAILGDGELHEGNIWEAVMSAGHLRLANLVAILDYNRIMSKGFVSDFVGIEPLADKWRAFNWEVVEVDGHNVDEVSGALDRNASATRDRPLVVIAHTLKGKGLAGAENSHRWHTHAPDPETADSMLRALARMYGRPEEGYSRKGLPVNTEVLHV